MLKLMKSTIAAALGLGLAMAVSAPADAQEKKVLKMQATWPASLTLYENFTMWAERVDKLSGGTLKIEAMPAGQVVPAFEVLDATHKKVLDGAHAWGGYWTGKDKTSILFTGGPGGTFGMDFTDFMGWMYYGGGWDLLAGLLPEAAQAQRGGLPDPAVRSAGVRLVQEADPDRRGHEGHEMPPDRHGRRGVAGAGLHRRQHARRRDHSLGPARRDRLRRVGRRRRGPAARLPQRVEVPLFAGRAREHHGRRDPDQWRRLEVADARSSRNGSSRRPTRRT